MKSVTSQYLNALKYSQDPIDRVDAFRGGVPKASNLSIAGGSISVQGGDTQMVRTTMKVVITDNTGDLVPEEMDDALAPFGSELQVHMGLRIGTAEQFFNMGIFRIASVEIEEQSAYVERPTEPGRKIWYSKGATITADCVDRGLYIETNKFINNEQPSGGNVFDETRRLLIDNQPPYGGTVGVVNNHTIPVGITYDLDRLKGLLDLADVIDCDGIINEQGQFCYRSRVDEPAVWRLESGKFAISARTIRTITSAGVNNGAVEKGTAEDERPLIAVRVIPNGPLAWGGPYGKNALQHASTLLTTTQMVYDGVENVMARALKTTPQQIPITCVRNPALQWGDYIEVPTRTGYIKGRAVKLDFPFGSNLMQIVLAVDPFTTRGLL